MVRKSESSLYRGSQHREFTVLPIMLWLIRRFWRKFTVQKFACMFEICGCVFSHVFGIYGRTSKHATTCGNHKIFRNIRPHGRMFASHNICEICGCVFSHVFGICGRTFKYAAACLIHRIWQNLRSNVTTSGRILFIYFCFFSI